MLHTTFNLAKQADACAEGIDKMRAALGPDWPDDKPIPLTLVLQHCGIEDAVWALRCTLESNDRLARLFACDCAAHVLPLFEAAHPSDSRPRQAIEVARRFAMGEASNEELNAAWAAAWAAAATDAEARTAAWAWAAAATEAAAVTRDAMWEAAVWAQDAAAEAAAWAVASVSRTAAWDAAREAERQWQAARLEELLMNLKNG